jgi:predicted dehydrogenase
MKKYKIGIIGYGGFGSFLHHWWDKMENAEVAAIAYLEHRPEEGTGCRLYSDWHELIKDPGIDIVSIVTPPGLHVEMACAAMRAGKHVLLEKPAAVTAEGAQELLDAARETGMSITVDHMIRYNPIIRSLIEISRTGALGKLRHAVVSNYAQDESLPPGHWFWDEEQSGGIQVEHGVHFFDIINALGGQRFVQVSGVWDNRNESQRDRVAAQVLYDGGLIASYYHAFSGPGFFERTTINLAYDRARVEIEGWMPLKGKLEALADANTRTVFEQIPGWRITHSHPIGSAADNSRPEGWGAAIPAPEVHLQGGSFEANELLAGSFEMAQDKGTVYGRCVQAILSDLIENVKNPEHKMAVTLDDAVEALRTALLATD